MDVKTCWDQEEMLTEMYYTDRQDAWLSAVIADDVETVREQLQKAIGIERHLLLEGWISTDSFWSNWTCKDAEIQHIMAVQRPLSLAALSESYRVISVFYKNGIDICQADRFGNNVIHTLVIHTSRNEGKESKYLEAFNNFARLLPRKALSNLLLAENTSGLRPLELAAHFQTFPLLEALFKIPGHYFHKPAKSGTISINYYDISDYECDVRARPWANSPMFLLAFFKCVKLKSEFTTKFITEGFLGEWVETRKKIYLPFIILWAIIRFLIISIAFFPAGLTDSVAPESTLCGLSFPLPDSIKTAAVIFLMTTALLFLSYDLYDVLRYYIQNKPWSKTYAQLNGHQVGCYYFYRIQQLLLNIAILTSCVNRMSWKFWKNGLSVYPTQMLFVIIVVTSVWCMLYFVQLMPVIGTYVMAIQRMFYNLGKFSIIMMIFVSPFMSIFPKFVSKNDDGTCPDEFSSAVSSWYTGFTTMLNMNDFRSFDAPSRESLWLIHVMYVTIVVILMLNVLIAIFIDSYREVANHPEVLANVQWMVIMAVIDFRVPRCMYPLVRWLKRRHFTYIDDRLFIKVYRTE